VSQLGLSLAPIDNDARAQFKLSGNVKGVVVTDVVPDSPAADKNLRAGDVIVQVQHQNVSTPDEFAKRVEADAKAGKKVELILVNRGGDLAYVALKLS
jgi:serine protease Do